MLSKKQRILVGILSILLVLLVVVSVIYAQTKQKQSLAEANSQISSESEIETETEGQMIVEESEMEAVTELSTEEISTEVTEEVAEENTDFYSNYVPPLTWTKRADSGSGFVVCIDPGHQVSGDSSQEPNGPGSATMKARVTGGTCGNYTGVYEYQLNLTIGLKLKAELESRGYTVYMTRESHEVNISNMERAQYATSVGADISVRIHANGCDSSSVSGALALAPSVNNPYVAAIASESQKLSSYVLNYYCSETGFNNQGVQANDTMTGINWCTMPVTILEMGYMTNYNDDVMMEDEGVQARMVTGIANGIDAYFAEW